MQGNSDSAAPVSEALIIEQDATVRHRLKEELARHGYGVRECANLEEGRREFQRQSLIIAHLNGNTGELRQFVDFVRTSAGGAQPFILALGETGHPTGSGVQELGMDAFIPTPLNAERLAEHLQSLAARPAPTAAPAAPPERAGSMLGRKENFAAMPAVSPARSAAKKEPAPPRRASVLSHFSPVLLDQLPQALALLDRQLRYLVANERYGRELDLDLDAIIGRSHEELFPNLHQSWKTLFSKALEGGIGRIEEDLFHRPDGTSDWVRWEVRPWKNEDGEIGGVVLSQEVIPPPRAERPERPAPTVDSPLEQTLFGSLTLPVLLVASDGRVLRSSPAARSWLGLQPTADGRLPFWEIYPETADEERERAAWHQAAAAWTQGGTLAWQPGDIPVPGPAPQVLSWAASLHRQDQGAPESVLLIGAVRDVPVPLAPESPAPRPPVVTPQPAEDEPLELAQFLPFGVIVLDRDGSVQSHNAALDALLGRGLLPALGVEAWLVQGAPEPLLREAIARDWSDNVWRRQLTRVFSLVGADGLLKEIELRPRPLSGGRLLVMVSDITETRRSEEILRTSEMKYRGLFREFPIALALADRTGAIVETNPALERLVGRSRQELRRLIVDDLLSSAEPLPSETEADGPARHTCQLATGQGERRPVTVTLAPICNPAGDLVLQSLLIQPASVPASPAPAPTPVAEAPAPAPPAPGEDPAFWRELAFANLDTALLVTDRRGRIRAANASARRFFGDEQAQTLEGKGLFQLFQPDDPKGFSADVSASLKQQRRWESETDFVRVDGRRGRCRAEITPTRDGQGLLCIVQPLFVAAAW